MLAFNGTVAQEISGSASTTFYCDVEINNAAGVSLTGADIAMGGDLTLTSGSVTLGTADLTLSSAGVTGASASNYVVTNSTGELKGPVTNADFVFPVGTASSYNPVTLNEATTPDTYGVIAYNSLPGGWTGTDHAVTASWDISEGTAGCDLTVTPQWDGIQEQTNFDNTDCAVGVSMDNGATVAWKASGAALGSDPYTRAGAGFTNVGTFLVGDFFFEGLEVDLDFYLAGPYNAATNLMNTTLRNANLVPLTDPYGYGITVGSIPSNVVDWVKVELRDKNNASSILYQSAFFLDNTGNVVFTDGTSGAKFTGVAKDLYYIAVKHRNHLGARTASTVDLTTANPAFNYKSNVGVYQNQAYTPQFNLNDDGNFALYKGNVNGDAAIRKTGTAAINDYTALLNYLGPNLFILGVYAGADVNMDANVRKTGTAQINDYTAILNSLGTSLFILQQM
jgi:hypothetical protein